jgi:hypothetical protein
VLEHHEWMDGRLRLGVVNNSKIELRISKKN